jgi:glycine C-acetyltransferase
VLVDARIHRSTRDGCRVSGASVGAFRHNDPESLEDRLRRAARGRTLIVVEGVYSMDGDVCPLPDVVALRERYGAMLLVDEAHSLGVLGATGRGVAERFGLPAGAADVWMGCLSKAVPSCGGYLAGRLETVTYLRHEAGPYFYSAALAPPTAAAARAALRVIESEPWRVRDAAANGEALRRGLRERGLDPGPSRTVIVPLLLGSEGAALRASRSLLDEDILASAVVPPAVPEGASRLRLCAMATHTPSDYRQLLDALDAVELPRGAGARAGAPS